MILTGAYTKSVALVVSEKKDRITEIDQRIVDDNQDFFTPSLLKHFKSADLLRFAFTHPIDIKYNILFEACRSFFKDDEVVGFTEIASKLLSEASTHPNIKPGDLLISKFTEIEYEGIPSEAIGIYKYDARQRVMGIDDYGQVSLKSGIGNQKPDKACLIIDTGLEPTLLILDNESKESEYWTSTFINAKPKHESANFTSEVISATKEFVSKKMPQEFEMTKMDQVDLMRRSMDYFKETDHFDQREFEQAVLIEEDVIHSFRTHKQETVAESGMAIPESFSMATAVVKKHAGNYKSILKLDKNFHIYIHGNRSLIENGTDENGRKFYKLYYDKEE